MVSTNLRLEELSELFDVRDGQLIGRAVPWRRLSSNSKVEGKVLGTINSAGYLEINFSLKDGTRHKMLVHRLIYYMHWGNLPSYLDHINRDKLDNRIENLRPCDKSLNAYNTRPRSNNKTGKKGVHYYKNMYRASIYVGNKKYHLGSYKNFGDACEAVDLRRNEEIKQARARGDISPLESCQEEI